MLFRSGGGGGSKFSGQLFGFLLGSLVGELDDDLVSHHFFPKNHVEGSAGVLLELLLDPNESEFAGCGVIGCTQLCSGFFRKRTDRPVQQLPIRLVALGSGLETGWLIWSRSVWNG